ncbi:flagellar biosynthetic protein FliO [Pseudoalteromonas citrea]|uniref:Flagellar protein n=1 Tax=Pseudoalteromonas citrea TaxID=43655 RepID=A0A5S3XVZ1_9GAMM|nr:flagellar biosynthetic protein FliO [Pseudoalteromonas citrea]TMP43456.1 flagellar biosynthetic protein FliO [Pseudoalteromonas citrea]TMP62145.1 flagellar biosynthetic protein FliO [Pseudoalteromonas citrea]
MNRLLFLFGLFPCVALSSTQTVGLSSELVSVALSLLMVVLLIIGLGFFLKKLNPNIGNNSDFKVVRSLPLGTKERLLVVEIDGKQLLLGVTPQNINYLHQLDTPLEVQTAPAFAKELSRFLTMNHKNNKNTSDD